MQNERARIENLIVFARGLMNKENGKELYEKYKADIENVTPQEVFEIFHSLQKQGTKADEILAFLDKVINVFYKSLSGYTWKKPGKDSFVGLLLEENKALVQKLEKIKDIIRIKDLNSRKEALLPRILELKEFNSHYLKKENILFPYMEKKMERFEGLSVMWALHDETRVQLESVIGCLESKDCGEAELNAGLGSLFFDLHGLVQKEELILFPAASEVIDDREWHEMLKQSMEYGFSFIEMPSFEAVSDDSKEGPGAAITGPQSEWLLKTETGVLDMEEVMMLFNALPVDMTFVDENNKVRFFTRPKDRIFPRSPAVIGRNVENCHPPESVHVVNEIIESFRSGKQDSAVFWINLKGRKIMIRYFALRDSDNNYRGVLEVSQDITEITQLEGERRLLHWER